ncbi:DsrE family protein [Acidithiobacillus thiooxidans]|nr:DsrE family protein [Acidithiobacillus thiooxidans]
MSICTLRRMISSFLIPLAMLLGMGVASANVSMLHDFNFAHPKFIHALPFATHKLVVQVSQDNPARWTLVLNTSQNLLNFFGQQKIQIVVVAFGPGLKMLVANSPVAKTIAAMNAEGVEFDACHNTMLAMAKKLGHLPKLVPSAVIVPAGIVRIMQLESHGFDYVKP